MHLIEMSVILSCIQTQLVDMLDVELIDAKQALAGDLCPLCPPAHYLVTNMAEG